MSIPVGASCMNVMRKLSDTSVKIISLIFIRVQNSSEELQSDSSIWMLAN